MKMLPLIDGAGYKLFDAKMLSLTDGAKNKLFGTKMLAPSSIRRWGILLEVFMLVSEGFFYHISDSFFAAVNDPNLMSNKEGGGYRPHFFAVRDSTHTEILWMIPVSSQYVKFKGIHDKMIARYNRCTKIVLGKCDGKDAAFLVQNAFPVTADYIDHIHTSQGQPLVLHSGTAKEIVRNLNENLRLHKRGLKLFFPDIDRLYQDMLTHIEELSPKETKSEENHEEIESEESNPIETSVTEKTDLSSPTHSEEVLPPSSESPESNE